MIIVAIIRVSGLHDRKANAIDLVWEYHWQWVEVCIAILMVSVTAFRSFFIQHSGRNQSPPKRPWYSGIKAAVAKYSYTSSGIEPPDRELPTIPGATMTGMRTFIEGNEEHDEGKDLHTAPRQSVRPEIRV